MSSHHFGRGRSGRHVVTWRDAAGGKRRQRSFATQAEARRFHATLAASDSDAKPARSMTVVELCERSIADRPVKSATAARMAATCRAAIAPYFGQRAAASLTRADVTAWVAWLLEDKAYRPRTIRTTVAVLAYATRWAVTHSSSTTIRAEACPYRRSRGRLRTNASTHGHASRLPRRAVPATPTGTAAPSTCFPGYAARSVRAPSI